MGIVHKLKPEVLNFILENKQKNPALSCRSLTQLVLEKLQIEVSKSSINAIFKEYNLSMPIGRRQKQKKRKFNMPVLPVIEGTKAVTVVNKGGGSVLDPRFRGDDGKTEPSPLLETNKVETKKEEIVAEQKKEEISPEEKRIKDAEEWAIRLQDEEHKRIEEKLRLEKQTVEDTKKKAEETEVRALLEEAARVKAKEEQRQRQQEEAKKIEEEKASKEAAEKKRLEEEQAKRFAEEKAAREAAEKKRLEDERLAQEAALKAEKEKWARLAEEEHKAKQLPQAEEVVLPKEEPVSASPLPVDRGCTGALLLKALDCLIGGSKQINDIIAKEMGVVPESIFRLTEALIFRALFNKDNIEGLWSLIGQQYPLDNLNAYYARIKELKNIKVNISNIFSGIFTEARGVGMHFIGGNVIYLDGQLHTSWPAQNIPYDFSCPVYELKNNLNTSLCSGKPLVLFSAPGYDTVPKDFFNLLLNIGSIDKYPDTLTLFGNNLEELENIFLDNKNNYSFIFGLWPWQFTSSRKVKRIGEFSLKHIEGIDKDFYLGEIEIDLLRLSTNQSLPLRGCAIKTNLAEKIRLVVLNNPKAPMAPEELAGIYLNHWPNLDEAFHDFSRKSELFAYVSNTQKFFSKDSCGIEIDAKAPMELEEIFAKYIKILDAYLRWHFLPFGYIEKDFSFTSEHFYKIPVKLTGGKNKITAQMQLEPGYQFLKDLEYLIRRLSERQISLADGRGVYFENAFK